MPQQALAAFLSDYLTEPPQTLKVRLRVAVVEHRKAVAAGAYYSGSALDDTRFYLYGMPTPDEVLGIYADTSGRSVEDIDYYLVLAYFKNAIVLEGRYAQFATGEVSDPKLEQFGGWVLEMAALAGELSGASNLAPAA